MILSEKISECSIVLILFIYVDLAVTETVKNLGSFLI